MALRPQALFTCCACLMLCPCSPALQDRASSGRPKPMPATTTQMVRSIWQNYFNALQEQGQKQQEEAAAAAAAAGEVAKEVEDDPLEEDEQDQADAHEDALAGGRWHRQQRLLLLLLYVAVTCTSMHQTERCLQ